MLNTRIAQIFKELIESLKGNEEDHTKLLEMQTLVQEQKSIASDEQEIFRGVVANVIEGIVTINGKGIIQTFNAAAENLFGYKAEEVIGQNIKMLMPEPYNSEHDGYLANYINTGVEKIIGIGREVTGLRKDGSTFPLDLSISRIELGREQIFAGILRDITEEKYQQEELEKSQQQKQSILDNVYEGIITIDAKGTVDSFNLAAEKIFGYRLDEVIGQNVKILMPEPYHSEHDGYLSSFMGGGKAKIIGTGREVEGRRQDGSTFPLFLAVTQIQNHSKPLFVGMVRDLSEQKRLEKLKNEFVSTVSHELRTPLTSIRGSLSLIESGVMGEVGEKISPLIQIALNNSERLILLINDILDMEKIESGKMDFDLVQTDLSNMIEEAIQSNEGFAKEHEVKLSYENPVKNVPVYIDMNRMQQVLGNLISNAVKYSPKDDTVTISLIVTKRIARIEVHDNGLGVPQEFKKQIFQKFAQADSSDTKQKGGTGLGLNISKAIIEKFGGNIGFWSPPGKGATFFVDLPVINEANSSKALTEELRGRILIVEDDHDVATLIRIMLENEDFECDIAYNAKEAKSLLKKSRYDAMTLDIMLPDQDGIALLEEIRSDEMFHDLAVVVVSAKALASKAENAHVSLEVIDWIHKPIDQEKLVRSLNKAMVLNENIRPRILHVEDDPDIARVVKILIGDLGEIDLVRDKTEAMKKLEEKEVYNLFLLDIMLPDGSSEELIPYIKEHYADIPIVLFSALEVDAKLKEQVSKALVKSRTSNTFLVETIKKIINND